MVKVKAANAPQPPSYLSAATRAWWRELVSTFQFEKHDMRTIEVAALAWDRLTEARKVIAKEGITIRTTKGCIQHPAVRVEHDSQLRYLRAVRDLNLGDGAPDPRVR
jgi:P27 family predicted phage terminase small subunit